MKFYEDAAIAIGPEKIGFSELTSIIGPMLILNHHTGKSIALLAENNHYRDVIILSRPFVESIINIGFICADEEKGIIKSKKYAYQKGYRDLFKSIKIEGYPVEVGLNDAVKKIIDGHRPPNLIQALEEYTTKKGKEVTSWTTETAKEKLEVVSTRFGLLVRGLLTFAFLNIYKDVSEIIHGSYYGVRIFLGMQQKDMTTFKDAESAAKYFTDHQHKLTILILQQVGISCEALIEILKQKSSPCRSSTPAVAELGDAS